VKRCPVCNREYPEEQNFCYYDGSGLVQASPLPEPVPVPEPPQVRKEAAEVRQAHGWIDVTLPSGKSFRASLIAPETTIGSSSKNHVSIEDQEVSRNHAVLRLTGANWYIIDTGSRNGTYYDRARIRDEGRMIASGDTFRLGRSYLKITLAPPDQPDRVADLPAAVRVAPPPTVAPPPQASNIPPLAGPSLPEPIQGKAKVQAGQAPQAGSASRDKRVLDGRYELESVLAQGSTGTIYRARRVLLGDFVAVKILAPELVKDRLAFERFRRQAQVAARIHHPNSVQIYDFGSTPEGDVYIVEELLSGQTLRDLLNKERGLTLQRIVGIFNQICGAVHAAHINGIVLRNIHPGSIFVERGINGEELIKVGGYGLAKLENPASNAMTAMTMVGQAKMLGKPQYMSPEQWLDKPLDSRSDVYSLGIILFELLTGEVPFDSDEPFEAARMHLNSPVPDITKFSRREIDEGIATVVNRALSKEPNQRPATALHIAAEFQAVCGVNGGIFRTILHKVAGVSAIPQVVIPSAPSPVPTGEESLPSAAAQAQSKGHGALNSVVVALMMEAFLSRLSSGLIKTAVPLYALLVFGLDITYVMALVLIQNIVPLLLRSYFGGLADKYGKKKVFMVSLTIRTAVSVLYVVATLPMLFLISFIRGIADSAKGPSASAMIADHTDEKDIAKAYSWYTTVKSTSGGIGEAVAAFLLVTILVFLVGGQTVTANVAILEETASDGQNKEEILRSADEVGADNTLPGTETNPEPRKVLSVEEREINARQVAIEDLPKIFDNAILRRTIVIIFIAAAVLSALSLILVQFYVQEKREKKEKKAKVKEKGKEAAEQLRPGHASVVQTRQPNVWAFALMGTLLTAPAYMVTGEFFTILAVKLEVTPSALGWIKLVAETIIPLVFGPFFGWLADRIGAGKVIALRSISNLVTSVLFWITPWFVGTIFLGVMIGLARGIDEIGKAAFKPTWGAMAAKVSSFNLANRSRTMGIMEGGVDASDLAFPVLAGLLLQYFSLGVLMVIRGFLAVVAEIYVFFLTRKYKL
jgi:eukaryotic-like serine/threonine-protein kinase